MKIHAHQLKLYLPKIQTLVIIHNKVLRKRVPFKILQFIIGEQHVKKPVKTSSGRSKYHILCI